MADKPDKKRREWTRNPEDPVYSGELLLPSFGIRVARSDPKTVIHPPGGGEAFPLEHPDSADTCSVSYFATKGELSVANQGFLRLDPGYLRRILLRILNDEEWGFFEHHHRHMKYWDDEPGPPGGQESDLIYGSRLVSDPDATAQVRLTDLRLATQLAALFEPEDLEAELGRLLPSLRLPVTKGSVTRWKWKTLKYPTIFPEDPSKLTRREQKQLVNDAVTVSFAAAALILLLDLDMGDLNEAGHDDLSRGIRALHKIVTDLIDALDGSVNKLEKLVANRAAKPPLDPEAKYYTALVLYRMGRQLKGIARRIRGLEDEEPLPKNWRSDLRETIRGGLKLEKDKFPGAAELFARRHEERVQAKAISMYRNYLHQTHEALATHRIDWLDVGDDLTVAPLDKEAQWRSASIQLGSCLERGGIDPTSPPPKHKTPQG